MKKFLALNEQIRTWKPVLYTQCLTTMLMIAMFTTGCTPEPRHESANDSDVASYQSQLGYSGWVGMGSNVDSHPRAIKFNELDTWVFYKGTDNLPYYFVTDRLIRVKSPPRTISDGRTAAPTIISDVVPVKVYTGGYAPDPAIFHLFATGTDNKLLHTFFDGSAFSNWEVIDDGPFNSDPVAVLADPLTRSVDVFVLSNRVFMGETVILHKYFDGTRWFPIDTIGGTISNFSALGSPRKTSVFTLSSSNQIDVYTISHLPRMPSITIGSLGGYLISAPTAAHTLIGDIVFARGGDNSGWYRKRKDDLSPWDGWETIGGVLISDVAIQSSTRVTIYALGTDNAIWTREYFGGWQPWTSLGGWATSNPTTMSAPDAFNDPAVLVESGKQVWVRTVNSY